MGWLEFNGEKADRFVVLPAGRGVCLMCDKESRQGEIIRLTDKFKVRLCPGCQKEYEVGIKAWKSRNL